MFPEHPALSDAKHLTGPRRQIAAQEEGFCALCRWLRCATGQLQPSAHGRWTRRASRRMSMCGCLAKSRLGRAAPPRCRETHLSRVRCATRTVYKSRLFKFMCFNGDFCVQVSANYAFRGFRSGDLYMEPQPEGRTDVQARLVQGNLNGCGRGGSL